jgi:hypothetical protein
MKIEIKKLKMCRGDETDAFSCDVHVDGVKVAQVRQAGRGGSHFWDWMDQSQGRSQMRETLLTWIKTPEALALLPKDETFIGRPGMKLNW